MRESIKRSNHFPLHGKYNASNLYFFSSPNIRVFDITYLDSPSQIGNLSIEQNNGSYRVYLPSGRGRVMYAVEDSAILQAASITQNTPSTLTTAAHNADLIIISHKDFLTQANDGRLSPRAGTTERSRQYEDVRRVN